MSDFSSLDLDQTIEQSSLTDTLSQPIWIALFTSVIIHAILGINLPKLSLLSKKTKLPPTVGLVELTPEQLERLPQPEEPEITFSTIPAPQNFFPITPATPSKVAFSFQSPSSELPTIPVNPSDYNLPKLPPLNSTTSSSSTSPIPTPSVSWLPKNPSPTEFSGNYPSITGRMLLPKTPIYSPPPPNTNPSPVDIFKVEPPQQNPKQSQIDESQIRKNLNLTDKVYESGLSRRPIIEIDPTEVPSVGKNPPGKSYSASLKLPPQRYQDKVENKTAITPTEDNTDTQPQKTSVSTATPKTPLPPDTTKKNRLPEAPIVTQLREGKTMQEIVKEAKQQQKIVVATPSPTETKKSQPETLSVIPNPKLSPTPKKTKEFKDVLLEKFQQPQQQKVTETTSFKGSLLQELQQQKQTNAAVNEESQSRAIVLGAFDAYMQWAIELEVGEESLTQSKAISDVYPEAACEQKLEGKATVGVLVSPDGTVSKGPKLLLESGSPMLDEAALDAVSKQSFNGSDGSKLYQYEFNFESSNCNPARGNYDNR